MGMKRAAVSPARETPAALPAVWRAFPTIGRTGVQRHQIPGDTRVAPRFGREDALASPWPSRFGGLNRVHPPP